MDEKFESLYDVFNENSITGGVLWDGVFRNPGPEWNFDHDATTKPTIPQVADAESHDLGQKTVVQTFYEGPIKHGMYNNEINWVEKPLKQVPEAARAKYDQAAMKIYKVKDKGSDDKIFGGLTVMKVNAVTIQSSELITAIKPFLADEGLRPSENNRIKIYEPFKEPYFAHPKIVALIEQRGPEAHGKALLETLVEVMQDLFSELSLTISQLQSKRQISWEHVWTLFPRNMIIYCRQHDHDRLYQVVSTQRYPSKWAISCCFVRFNGTIFGMNDIWFEINKFEDAQLIEDLPLYPIGFHSDANLEKKLVERGRLVLAFQNINYGDYDGIGKEKYRDEDGEDVQLRHYVNGRVIIDAFGYCKFNPKYAIKVKQIKAEDTSAAGDDTEMPKSLNLDIPNVKPSSKWERPSAEQQQSNKAGVQARRLHLLLMSPMLAGFSLSLRKWLWLSVESVKPLSWNNEAYDHLVCPADHKSLLLTLVKNHKQSKQNDDVIAGKGLVVLLSGSTGTGKTLTAESVADKARRPLYKLPASEASDSLARTLELATEWNAIVLVDEADTILAKRSHSGDDDRNEVVSEIFHQLEYFAGIIFLTTNLLSNIEPAFLSRIHIHLPYPPLSIESRSALWKNFLNRLQPSASESSEHDRPRSAEGGSEKTDFVKNTPPETLNKLAAWILNGRQIKNVVKTAHLWCSCNGYPLTLDRLEAAIHVTAPFAEKFPPDKDYSSCNKRPRLSE